LTVNHSDQTHRNLIARIPSVTGRDLPEWFASLESGPAFLRCEERAQWLADEHGLSHGYASAIVHEYERQRRTRLSGAEAPRPGGAGTPRPWPAASAGTSAVGQP
jgi:hypothetical protein